MPAGGLTQAPTPASAPESSAWPTPAQLLPSGSSLDLASGGVATRLVIAYLGVDLPVVSGDLDPPGNTDSFPLCDVAQYLTVYVQPGIPGTTYLFAHARNGMLGPLLQASEVDDGAALLGQQVLVYTSGGWLFAYQIFVVNRHALDFSLADEIAPGEQRLIVQTSEGTNGTVPKLQIAAQPMWRMSVPLAQAMPSPEPRICAPGT